MCVLEYSISSPLHFAFISLLEHSPRRFDMLYRSEMTLPRDSRGIYAFVIVNAISAIGYPNVFSWVVRPRGRHDLTWKTDDVALIPYIHIQIRLSALLGRMEIPNFSSLHTLSLI